MKNWAIMIMPVMKTMTMGSCLLMRSNLRMDESHDPIPIEKAKADHAHDNEHNDQELREIRADHRQNGEDPDASELAGGLMRYSERGQEYIDELRAMIRHNTEVIEEARERLESNS